MGVSGPQGVGAPDWHEVLVADLASPGENALATGPFGSNIGLQFFKETGIPLIRGSNLGHDGRTHLVEDDYVFVSEAKAAELRRSTVTRGDLVFTCWGTINQVGLVGSGAAYPRYVISNKQMKMTPDSAKADSLFLFYLFSGPELQRRIIDQGIGSSIPGFNLGQLRSMRLRVPSVPEQRAISAALADADALLGALEKLIAKKRDLKQASMQQLLTGKTRLPGFHGEWADRRVDQMGEVLAGKALAAYAPGPSRPYLRTKNVLDGCIDVEGVLEMPMTDAEFERFRVLEGDVLLNEGQALELVGRCSTYQGEFPLPCAMQNQLLRFRARKEISPRFAEQLFRHCQHTGIFASIATQTTSVAHLGTVRFSKLRLRWPRDLGEQATIAAVLSDMDAEIDALQARLTKTRDLKQGMMQELLTGRIRLV
jgi:type I restriction enzyme S subunit